MHEKQGENFATKSLMSAEKPSFDSCQCGHFHWLSLSKLLLLIFVRFLTPSVDAAKSMGDTVKYGTRDPKTFTVPLLYTMLSLVALCLFR
ncbi:hypothetical protein E2C01_078591 [Portunus trituberculatus]|uniref:Uncharacterized protein n=1 Tax=Portunus trituberculatus TaxID=210409 RepID=A0A5B7IEQ4_PORTR|nr:hypothetical protein [Portunus trituberculatus]